MELSKRLQAVADMVSPGRRVADVGCDHGYISIYLIEQNVAAHVFAMDVNQGPLERAKEHIEKAGLMDQIDIRLSDGAKALKAEEADCMVIAGMGGRLMERILGDAKERGLAFEELVLQPQSEPFKVREYLWQNGYYIADEAALFEEGKFYQIIKALRGEENALADYSEAEREAIAMFGPRLLETKNVSMMQYLETELKKCDEIKQHIMEQKTTKELAGCEEISKREQILSLAKRIGESYGSN